MTHFRPHLERDLPYEVRAIRMTNSQCFFSPRGIVYFTTGMIQLPKAIQIAGVMAHELPIPKKHVMIQVARNQKLSLLA